VWEQQGNPKRARIKNFSVENLRGSWGRKEKLMPGGRRTLSWGDCGGSGREGEKKKANGEGLLEGGGKRKNLEVVPGARGEAAQERCNEDSSRPLIQVGFNNLWRGKISIKGDCHCQKVVGQESEGRDVKTICNLSGIK